MMFACMFVCLLLFGFDVVYVDLCWVGFCIILIVLRYYLNLKCLVCFYFVCDDLVVVYRFYFSCFCCTTVSFVVFGGVLVFVLVLSFVGCADFVWFA